MVIYSELEKRENASLIRKRDELTQRLIELTKKNGYEIIQTNGQRVYAPPASRNIKPPTKGCEVFIGKLHKNIFEDELIPLFEKIGPLFKFRLMLDFTERTRGYAFATYFNPEDANKAIAKLDNYEVRPRSSIGVYKSVDNCRLFIGNLPGEKTKEEVMEMLNKYVEGVVDLIMYSDYERPWLNRGFVFVEFENHRLAAMARRQFTPDNLIAWGEALYVDWADPLPDVDPKIMTKVTILYLRNVPLDYNNEEISTCVCNVVGSQIVKKVHKTLNYAFVHFVSRNAAEIAKRKLENFFIGNHQIGVEWARPRRYSKKSRLTTTPENFCTSVSPNMRRLVHQRVKALEFPNRSSSSVPERKKPKKRYGNVSNSTDDELCNSFGTMSLSEGATGYYHLNATDDISSDVSTEAYNSEFSTNLTHFNSHIDILSDISSQDMSRGYYHLNLNDEISNACSLELCKSEMSKGYYHLNTNDEISNACAPELCNSDMSRGDYHLNTNDEISNACSIELCKSEMSKGYYHLNTNDELSNACSLELCNSEMSRGYYHLNTNDEIPNACSLELCKSEMSRGYYHLNTNHQIPNACSVELCTSGSSASYYHFKTNSSNPAVVSSGMSMYPQNKLTDYFDKDYYNFVAQSPMSSNHQTF